MFPNIAHAAISETAAKFIDNVITLIVNPLITLLMIVGVVVFLFGMVRFIASSDKSSEDAIKGRKHMLYGILGLFIMFSVFGIMRVVVNSLDAKATLPQEAQDRIY